MKQYFVVARADEELFQNVKNERELAELWEMDNNCGVYNEIKAWEYVDGEMKPVDVEEIAMAYLREQREIQEEYEEYTEMVNEYGYDYDYYENPDNLEMGFDPYMGDYSYDC